MPKNLWFIVKILQFLKDIEASKGNTPESLVWIDSYEQIYLYWSLLPPRRERQENLSYYTWASEKSPGVPSMLPAFQNHFLSWLVSNSNWGYCNEKWGRSEGQMRWSDIKHPQTGKLLQYLKAYLLFDFFFPYVSAELGLNLCPRQTSQFVERSVFCLFCVLGIFKVDLGSKKEPSLQPTQLQNFTSI